MLDTTRNGGICRAKTPEIAILLPAVKMMFSLFGSGHNKQFDIPTYINAAKNSMLLDYYERVVGIPVEMPYYEIVLYTHSDSKAKLEEYRNGGTENETITSWLIPLEAAQEMLTAVKKSGMASWNDKRGAGLCGKMYVCKFPDGRDGYIRISSANMPEKGSRAFGAVKAAMCSWMKDAYLFIDVE